MRGGSCRTESAKRGVGEAVIELYETVVGGGQKNLYQA